MGSWLPEPLLTTPDVAADVELAESVSMGLMVVLETLTPAERAVFVLREAFGLGFDEIAAAVEKSPAAVHQIAHRARRHVEARRPRRAVTVGEAQAAVEASRRALETRDLQGLLDVLAPEVVAISDGGGIKQASPRPIIGADKVVRFMVAGLTKHDVALTVEPTAINGSPALALHVDGELDGVIAVRVEDTRITGLYFVRNPHKLTHIDTETPLTCADTGHDPTVQAFRTVVGILSGIGTGVSDAASTFADQDAAAGRTIRESTYPGYPAPEWHSPTEPMGPAARVPVEPAPGTPGIRRVRQTAKAPIRPVFPGYRTPAPSPSPGLAIEDAVTLAASLEQHGIDAGLRAYDELRRPRTEKGTRVGQGGPNRGGSVR